ncbi:MAG TPA: hypothetical protein VNS55_11585 [Nocardioides sp.]|nr:hypothetical protein [Nocardioides sp.]
MTRRLRAVRTPIAVAAVAVLAAACSETDADPVTETADSPSAASAPADGVQALPGPDPGADSATLAAGRYRVPLGDDLAFEVDVPDDTSAHDGGLFLATGSVVLKTEVAGTDYGLPRDPCSVQAIDPVGPTVDDLVRALGELPVYELSRPEPVELGGAEGSYVEARIPRSYDASQCEGQDVQLPGNPDTAVSGAPPYRGRWWILDVDGQRVVVQQNCWDCSADELDGAAATAESITFTPAP